MRKDKIKVELNLKELEVEEFDWATSTWKKVPQKELDKLSDKSVRVY